jgi:hypothetical protein
VDPPRGSYRRISSQPWRRRVFSSKGFAAREQLVEEDAQRVDVGARVHVEAAELRLLGRHVLRRPDDLPELGEERLLREPAVRGLGDPEVDHLRHRLAVVERDEDVRRLQVAVDDALAVRVLDRAADGP